MFGSVYLQLICVSCKKEIKFFLKELSYIFNNFIYSQKLSMEQEVAAAFLRSFQLSSAEQAILRGTRDGAITGEFFVVLNRVQSIHHNCRTLMQSGHQTAALEIMEQMALYQVKRKVACSLFYCVSHNVL